MIGDSTDRTSFRSRVGIGSRGHEALDAFLMIDVMSDVVAGLKLCSSEVDDERRELTGGQFKSLVEVALSATRVVPTDPSVSSFLSWW